MTTPEFLETYKNNSDAIEMFYELSGKFFEDDEVTAEKKAIDLVCKKYNFEHVKDCFAKLKDSLKERGTRYV